MSDNQWIPIDERLPPDNVAVLVYLDGAGVEMAYRTKGQWGISFTDHVHAGHFYTHWMPLPAGPEGDGCRCRWPRREKPCTA
jgi:hypothetical protein